MSKAKDKIASQARNAPPIADHIEQQLQAAYSEILQEPIPARFLGVLDMLESGAKESKSVKRASVVKDASQAKY
ncbi:MAG: NepR family anti-sigma factor [Methylocystis sp.]|uniref:NepR family anti-sigma factor n=1 Tax=Methylocystis sp. TaxID=1911079 RepID=UPI003DA3DC77